MPLCWPAFFFLYQPASLPQQWKPGERSAALFARSKRLQLYHLTPPPPPPSLRPFKYSTRLAGRPMREISDDNMSPFPLDASSFSPSLCRAGHNGVGDAVWNLVSHGRVIHFDDSEFPCQPERHVRPPTLPGPQRAWARRGISDHVPHSEGTECRARVRRLALRIS